jgi:hypothetical protein
MGRTEQQKTGDELEQDALQLTQEYFPEAKLSKGSGSLHKDGDIVGAAQLFLECKNSAKRGKGRSISKKDWEAIKDKAARFGHDPVHIGYDDDGEMVSLCRFRDLLAFAHAAQLFLETQKGERQCQDSRRPRS